MIGTRIGDYVIESELSATTMQIAYAAAHVLLPRRARITISAASRDAAMPLMREACVLEALQHPGVPRVFECGVVGRRPWIATELVDGTTVADALERGVMGAEAVATLIRDVAEILAHAHRRGVIHRNLSPELLVRGTSRRHAPVCILGWHHARCGEPVDGSEDIRALGVIAYRALTLDEPTLSAAEMCPGVPLALTRLIDRLLAADPARRPTAAQLHADALRVLELIELPLIEDGDGDLDIEQVEVDLVDISATPTPTPPPLPRVRWTPADAYLPKIPTVRFSPTDRKSTEG